MSGPLKFSATLSSFFDRESIMTPARKAEKKVLGGLGAYCRTVAMRSIKTVADNKPSLPGDPPFNHAGSLGANKKGRSLGYKDFIFFSYDQATHSVYIGPCILSGASAGPDICRTLEYGGDETIWVSIKGKRVQVTAHFEARPHMRPALAKTIASKKFDELLTDCVINEAGASVRTK